jgi:ribosomal protein S18 acetylase RimI-like enzyme
MLTIRLAEEKDLEFLKASYKLLDNTMNGLVKQLTGMVEGEEAEHSDEYWLEFIQQKSGYIFIALQDNKPAGIAVVLGMGEQEVHLEDLVVWPDFRKQGIGEALVKEAKAFALEKGYKCMSLNALPNNDVAIHLYENEGFKERKISMLCRLEQ